MKYTKQIDDGPAMAGEPTAAFGAAIKSRPVNDFSKVDDDSFWDNLSAEQLRTMPCQFTEEELDEEIRLSEASGFISNEEVMKRFARWGYFIVPFWHIQSIALYTGMTIGKYML